MDASNETNIESWQYRKIPNRVPGACKAAKKLILY